MNDLVLDCGSGGREVRIPNHLVWTVKDEDGAPLNTGVNVDIAIKNANALEVGPGVHSLFLSDEMYKYPSQLIASAEGDRVRLEHTAASTCAPYSGGAATCKATYAADSASHITIFGSSEITTIALNIGVLLPGVPLCPTSLSGYDSSVKYGFESPLGCPIFDDFASITNTLVESTNTTPAALEVVSASCGEIDQPALGRGTVEQRVAAAETRLEALQRTVAAAAEERLRLKEELMIELGRKAGIDEVEKLRASLFEHTGGLPDALRPLRDELQLGRWVWKAASHLKLAAGGKKELACMPWGAERANHWPDNFGWSKDRAHIAVAQPGLYAVSCGAFSAGAQPTLSLVVNGVVVLRRAGGTARCDPSGRVAGTSLRDYVTLPADAKVAVALEVHGDGVTGVGAQGFLELRKL